MKLDILVVYADPLSSDGARVARGLQQTGHRVLVTHDAEQALRLVDSELPDAIVTTELSPPLDAVELCWAVRKTSRAPDAVFVVIGHTLPTNKRIEGYRTGVDLFLETPVSVHELAGYLRSQVGLRNNLDTPDIILAGHMSKVGLLEVLQIALNAGRSGRLDVWTAAGHKAHVYIRKGQPVHAVYGDIFGRAALQELARLRDGAFRFLEESHFPETNITEPASQLILDLARVLDEEANS